MEMGLGWKKTTQINYPHGITEGTVDGTDPAFAEYEADQRDIH